MNYTKQTYIFGLIAAFAFASCADDLLIDSPEFAGSSEYISFAAGVSTAGALASRSADTPYEPYDPLVLDTDEGELPVYLHTYEHAIGSEYAEQQPQSRGEQVNNVPDFVRILKAFAVNGINSDGEVYFDMRKAHSLTEDNLYWSTDGLIRWPRKDRLQFHAIAPDNHLDKLDDVSYSDKAITFSYTAKKSNDGKTDAVAQTDLMMAVASMTLDQAADFDYHVPLKFNHALSAIKFAVRDVIKGKVKSITIKGVKGSGECTYTANYDSDGGNFEWDTESVIADAEFTQEFNYELNADFPFNTVNVDSEEAEEYDIVLTDKMPTKTFMLIPQVIPSDARIELVIEQELTEGNKRTITVGGKIGNNVKEWLPGYEYIYTISTSKDNWIYVFDAEGNDAEGRENIFVYSPGNEKFATLGNNAYFSVKSYRYRANNMEHVEALPWTASHGGSYSYKVENGVETAYPEANPGLKEVTAEQWIQDQFTTPLSGKGIANVNYPWEKHDLTFLAHYVTTNWPGDETMQGYLHYAGFTEQHPYDLSTFGGLKTRTTANCYVIDRGGWYMLPLVYGNAIKDNNTNASAYQCGSTLTGQYQILKTLKDYNDNNITQPYIKNVNGNCRAMLIWQDAYNMIHNVELAYINNEWVIRFYVDSNNLQQGNAILALLDGPNGNVMWSWHIWATEHWIDKDTRLPHVFDTNNSTFNTFRANPTTGIRESGDVAVTYNQGNYGPFYMSPYNLGWCDPKKVLYLQRVNRMDFVQYMSDGSPTGYTDKLPIIQQGETIDYRFANNTYYQWGRKDPMRGYINHESDMKAVFGNRLSSVGDQGSITIGTSIRNPQIFYGNKGVSKTEAEDWLMKDGYLNLWNNHSDVSGTRQHGGTVLPTSNTYRNFWVHLKTVYDPSPAGYMVPNAGVLHFVHKSANESWYGGSYALNVFKSLLNGEYIDDYNYKVWGNGVANNNNAIFFSSTGNRWWTSDEGGKGGDNFGNTTSYAWSSRSIITDSNGKREAYGLALGLSGTSYWLGAQFLGRRAMGRPVRAIREL